MASTTYVSMGLKPIDTGLSSPSESTTYSAMGLTPDDAEVASTGNPHYYYLQQQLLAG